MKTTRIVYNACYGGFGLSEEAMTLIRLWHNDQSLEERDLKRTDAFMLTAIDTIGLARASGDYASLKIRELPEGTKWRIDEYDGFEEVKTIDEYEWEVA